MPATFSAQSFSALISCFGQLGFDLLMNMYGDTASRNATYISYTVKFAGRHVVWPGFLEDITTNGELCIPRLKKLMSCGSLHFLLAGNWPSGLKYFAPILIQHSFQNGGQKHRPPRHGQSPHLVDPYAPTIHQWDWLFKIK